MASKTKLHASDYFKYLVIMGLLAILTYTLPSVQAAMFGN